MNQSPTLTPQIEAWLLQCQQRHIDHPLLKQACLYAQKLSENTISPYAENTLTQGLEMANELIELSCEPNTLAAAILYPSVYYQQTPAEELKLEFGPLITKLVVSAERMEGIHDISRETSTHPQQLDNMRKMLLAMVDDIRIVLIKLAERVVILKNLKKCSEAQQYAIAKQTMDLYASLANRLGIGQLKWQLEDLSFRYLNKEQYFAISKALNMRRSEREVFIAGLMKTLENLLSLHHITHYEVTGRAKHIYSIHKKISRKQVGIEEIYDISALRILVPSIEDCYTALSAVHERFESIQSEFDDYIAHPKPNGYRSIHTAIKTEEGYQVEIQFRTFAIHEESELGVAAHWKYKEGSTDKTSYEDKIAWLREVMDWQKEISDERTENVYRKIFEDRIYVFTPNGDIFDLMAHATPLDFAYQIHTQVGHCCKGAKVNGKLVQLTHALQMGDQVEILTQKEPKPSRDWLNEEAGYLKTPAARAKVRHWFKQQNFAKNLEEGLILWEKATRHTAFKKADIQTVMKALNFKTVEDVLANIGSGHLQAITVVHALTEKKSDPSASTHSLPTTSPYKQKPRVPQKSGNLLTQLARCCTPILGDEITGYITTGRGISIHKADCKNIQQSLRQHPQRVIPVTWEQAGVTQYSVQLFLEAQDRMGLIGDISAALSNEKISLQGLNSRLNKNTQLALIELSIDIPNKETLQKIIHRLEKIDSILAVRRS